MEEKEYSVSEAVRLVGVESHVLRYWEDELRLTVRRNAQGHRVYSEENICVFCRVRELKERGLQLKAIRLLMDEQEKGSPDGRGAAAGEEEVLGREPELTRQIREFVGSPTAHGDSGTETGAEEEPGLHCDLITVEAEDPVFRFERILRRLIEEVVSEQNDRLEEALALHLREELEDFYLQTCQMMQEAAAALETGGRRQGRIRSILEKLFHRKEI